MYSVYIRVSVAKNNLICVLRVLLVKNSAIKIYI